MRALKIKNGPAIDLKYVTCISDLFYSEKDNDFFFDVYFLNKSEPIRITGLEESERIYDSILASFGKYKNSKL